MKKTVAFFAALVLLFSFLCYDFGLLDFVHPQHTPQPGQIRVACVGDSITYGCNVWGWRRHNYPAVLGKLLGDDYCVNNFGYSSRTAGTHGDRPYIDEKLFQKSLRFQPDVVVLMLGTNDSKSYNWDKEDFEAGFSALLDSYLKLPNAPQVVVLLPPPVFSRIGQRMYHMQPRVLQHEILPATRAIAQQKGVQTVDLFAVFRGEKALFPDGVHPNADGAKQLAQTVYQTVFEITELSQEVLT